MKEEEEKEEEEEDEEGIGGEWRASTSRTRGSPTRPSTLSNRSMALILTRLLRTNDARPAD